jgi:hypothetical protein
MSNRAWTVIGGINAAMVLLLAGWVWRVDRRRQCFAVRAAQAEQLALSAHTRLDLHADALTPGATSSPRPPTRLRLSVVTRDV